MRMHCLQRTEESCEPLGSRLTGSFSHHVDVGKQTQFLCNSRKCSLPQSHISSPHTGKLSTAKSIQHNTIEVYKTSSEEPNLDMDWCMFENMSHSCVSTDWGGCACIKLVMLKYFQDVFWHKKVLYLKMCLPLVFLWSGLVSRNKKWEVTHKLFQLLVIYTQSD